MVGALAFASLGAWIYLAAFHGRFWKLKNLLEAPRPSSPGARRVAVVIPARDEAATIGATVRSLKSQDWPGQLRIYVADDASTDATAAIARDAGATVVPAGVLPSGWTGKVWAMSRGVEHAMASTPDYILFTDADIVHGPDSVRRLLARAEADGFDLVSVMVKLNCRSVAERVLVPAFVFFFFMLYPPSQIASRRRRVAGAAGGCILLSSSMLSRVGGIASIRGELIDDCALAKRVKAAGGAVWLGMSESTRSVRPYPEFRDLRRMISRTAFTQLRYSPVLLAGTIAGLALLYAVPVVAAVQGNIAGAAAWILMSAIYAPMLRFYGISVLQAPLLPGVALFYAAATVESAVRYWTGRGGAWKGRNQAQPALR